MKKREENEENEEKEGRELFLENIYINIFGEQHQ